MSHFSQFFCNCMCWPKSQWTCFVGKALFFLHTHKFIPQLQNCSTHVQKQSTYYTTTKLITHEKKKHCHGHKILLPVILCHLKNGYLWKLWQKWRSLKTPYVKLHTVHIRKCIRPKEVLALERQSLICFRISPGCFWASFSLSNAGKENRPVFKNTQVRVKS